MASDSQAISNAIPVSDASPRLKSPNLETTAFTEPHVTDPHETAVFVPFDYKKPNLFATYSPFSQLISHESKYSHLVTKDELIEFMTPPLQFSSRKWMVSCYIGFWVFLPIVAVLWGIAAKVDDKFHRILTVCIAGGALLVVILMLVIFFFAAYDFRNRLLEYVDELNRTKLRRRGVQFFYRDYTQKYFGKDTGELWIRRYPA